MLNPSGYNALNDRIEVYLKVGHTKAALDSIPEKTEYTIPLLTSITGGIVYRVIEEWIIKD